MKTEKHPSLILIFFTLINIDALKHIWQRAKRGVVALLLVPGLAPGLALGPVTSVAADDSAPAELRLIELYTSHGCSSCPSADQLLGELLNDDAQLMALEFHVDYWNNLVHGKDGSFTDPFSKPEYSLRQREYNSASLSGRPGVYTPQAVVNGRFAAVGSNRRHIRKALGRTVVQMLQIHVEAADDPAQLSVRVAGSPEQLGQLAGTDIRLARYIDKAVTKVTGGENNEKSLTNHHIVTSLTTLGEVSERGEMVFTIANPDTREGCVVLVQEEALTPVFAAAECP